MVNIQEAENQIITAYEIYDQRPLDRDLLIPAVETHEERLERVPDLVAGDAGFYSAQGEAKVQEMGVKRVSIPTTLPRAPNDDGTKNNAGSAKGKSGERAAKAESAYSSGGTA